MVLKKKKKQFAGGAAEELKLIGHAQILIYNDNESSSYLILFYIL